MFSIILGSGSPRRAAILKGMSLSYERRPVDLDESVSAHESPLVYVRRLAAQKSMCAAEKFGDGQSVVIGADTVVVLDDEILGKPVDAADATKMLSRLSGRTHHVITAVALAMPDGALHVCHDQTAVAFRTLKREEIHTYIETGSPFDKAGGYGIQDDAAAFVSDLDGSFSNVVGLPVETLVGEFERLGLIECGLGSRLLTIRGRMAAAAPNHEVKTTLIGASKAHSVESIQTLQNLGVHHFGESYVQEWLLKQERCGPSPHWHFMGRLQSNKLKKVVAGASLIHTVSSVKHLRKIDQIAKEMGKRMPCLLQVNIGNEVSKGGVATDALGDLVSESAALEHIECRGLMTLPPRGSFGKTRAYFGRLKSLGERYFPHSANVELSMGMSEDLENAISQGATMIRVGTALFGPRQ